MNAAVAHTFVRLLKTNLQTVDMSSNKDLSLTKHSTVTAIRHNNNDDNIEKAVKNLTAK